MSVDDKVLVVGTGPSGAMAAASLVARGVDVLMLDAALRAPAGVLARANGNTVARWRSSREIARDRLDSASGDGVEWWSSVSLGGLSNYWTASVPRFAPADFDEAGRLDERFVWPVRYDDLVPYYERAESLLTVTAGDPIPGVPPSVARYQHRAHRDWAVFAERARRSGHGVGVIPMAKGRPWMVARRGTEFSSYHCVVRPLVDAGRLELRTGADVVALRWSPALGRVDAVEYLDRHTGTRRVEHGRAVVVAAGAIDTTMLLLQSVSSDFPDGLGNAKGLVGRYLHDHPREWWVGEPSVPMTALAHPMYVARLPHETAEPLMATSMTIGLASRSDRLRTYYGGKTPMFGVQVFGTMVPEPARGVTCGAVLPDGSGRRRPAISLRYDDAAVRNLESARARLPEVFASAGLGVRLPGPFHDLTVGSSVHFGGTVRMHRSQQFGALDEWNRLRDVPNVAVADSSSFTTGPEKNPTLTAMALAARAADRLADDMRAGVV